MAPIEESQPTNNNVLSMMVEGRSVALIMAVMLFRRGVKKATTTLGDEGEK